MSIIILDLVEKFNSLDKNVKIIIVLVLVIILLSIGTNILKNMNGEDIWDYKIIDSASTLLEKGKLVNDRILYLELKTIINNMLEDVIIDINEENTKYYNDYYSILDKDYKKHLNKTEFKSVLDTFINKFIIENDTPAGIYSQLSNHIEAIYEFDDDSYLCKVVTEEIEYYDETNLDDNETVIQTLQDIGYIGIKLNTINNTYKIFYLE